MSARLATANGGPRFGLLLAWAAIDAAVAVYLTVYGANVVSAALLALGLVAFARAALTADRSGVGIGGLAAVLLVGHLAIAAIQAYRAESPPPPEAFRLIPVIALLVVAVSWLRSRAVAPWALAAVIVAGLAYRAAIIALDIWPSFDVPLLQEAAGRAILGLSDPYLITLGPTPFPYLPVAALAAAAGEVLGDARWAGWLGDAATVAGIVLFARRAGADARLGLVLAALWAWWSGGLYVTWQGFPEPVLIGLATLGAAALAGPRPRMRGAGLLIGLAVATKQFGLGLVPFLPWTVRSWRSALVTGAVTIAVVVLPFALWHPDRFLEGAVLFHLREPGRPFALNLLNWPTFSLDPPLVLVVVAALAFGWACRLRQRSPMTAWLAGSAGLLLFAFELNRIAFVNYYAIPLALILLLVLAIDGEERSPARAPA